MGKFVTLEGIEGSGKTTQIISLEDYLNAKKIPYVVTKEPGGTIIGNKIRRILLDPKNSGMTSLTELLLYGGDRSQHIEEIIKPALRKGKLVLCDRYADATIVYQGYARGIDMKLIETINTLATGGLMPDLTILLDGSPEVLLNRAWRRIKENNDKKESRFEMEKPEFHEKIREGYLKLANKNLERYVIINAEQKKDSVKKEIYNCVNERLGI